MNRPGKTQYLMRLAYQVATRSTCRKTVDGTGCVIADSSGRILATGYNGSTPGAPHCEDVGHLILDGHCVRTVHAEMNAVADAARRGAAVNGATAYCVLQPCKDCLKLLAAAGIVSVVYAEEYIGEHGQALMGAYQTLATDSGIKFIYYPKYEVFGEYAEDEDWWNL